MISLMQGDALGLPLLIGYNGSPVTPEDVDEMRVLVDTITKSYPGDIYFADRAFIVPITQEESFSLPVGVLAVTVRVKFKDATIRGWSAKAALQVNPSSDRVVF